MPRAPKPCAQCGAPVVARTYCDTCQTEKRRTAPLSPTARHANTTTERQRRKAAVLAWVRINGWVCPGWQRAPHPAHDLTAAHITAVRDGGGDGPLTVLCRSCNSKQGVKPAT